MKNLLLNILLIGSRAKYEAVDSVVSIVSFLNEGFLFLSTRDGSFVTWPFYWISPIGKEFMPGNGSFSGSNSHLVVCC